MKSEDSFFAAAIESATAFNQAVQDVALTSGLFDSLSHFSSVDAVIRRMGFLPEHGARVENLLRILSNEGSLIERQSDGLSVFRANTDIVDVLRDRPNGGRFHATDTLTDWYDARHLERIRESNFNFFGRDLSFLRRRGEALRFDGQYEDVWRTNLTNPLYEFGRLLCVRELVAEGATRFLDLACGMGFGSQRLAEFADGPARITGVDRSSDFLQIARQGSYLDARTDFIERDLNSGLITLPAGSVDGILFNGAFHFIQDKPALLRQMWQALRPGARLAIGHCFSRSNFADERMHDFHFSLLENVSWPLPWSELVDLVDHCGFEVYKQFHRGSHSYLVARRLAVVSEPDVVVEPDLDSS
ncbi:MAG: class I SAM-dependent methyltransferase [Jatrophihabitans sp.]